MPTKSTPSTKRPTSRKPAASGSLKPSGAKYTAEKALDDIVDIIADTKSLHTTQDDVRARLNLTPQQAFHVSPDKWHEVTAEIGRHFKIELSKEPTHPDDTIQDFVNLVMLNLSDQGRLLMKTSAQEKAATGKGAKRE